jgi:hypothetical protein
LRISLAVNLDRLRTIETIPRAKNLHIKLHLPRRTIPQLLLTERSLYRYTEVKDPARLLSVMEEYLTDYNTQSKTPMKLVLFQYAAQHVCRISRVIRQPFGNALLVGVGGSGRQSLTKLAAAMAGFHLFQVRALYVLFSSTQYAKIVWGLTQRLTKAPNFDVFSISSIRSVDVICFLTSRKRNVLEACLSTELFS